MFFFSWIYYSRSPSLQTYYKKRKFTRSGNLELFALWHAINKWHTILMTAPLPLHYHNGLYFFFAHLNFRGKIFSCVIIYQDNGNIFSSTSDTIEKLQSKWYHQSMAIMLLDMQKLRIYGITLKQLACFHSQKKNEFIWWAPYCHHSLVALNKWAFNLYCQWFFMSFTYVRILWIHRGVYDFANIICFLQKWTSICEKPIASALHFRHSHARIYGK